MDLGVFPLQPESELTTLSNDPRAQIHITPDSRRVARDILASYMRAMRRGKSGALDEPRLRLALLFPEAAAKAGRPWGRDEMNRLGFDSEILLYQWP